MDKRPCTQTRRLNPCEKEFIIYSVQWSPSDPPDTCAEPVLHTVERSGFLPRKPPMSNSMVLFAALLTAATMDRRF